MPYTLILVQHDEGDEIYRAAKDKFGNMVLATWALPEVASEPDRVCAACCHYMPIKGQNRGECRVNGLVDVQVEGRAFQGYPIMQPGETCERFEAEPPF